MILNPKVSVAIPVYNVEAYIERAINSIFNQDYDNIEIIALYDRSVDNSLDVLKKSLSNSRFPYTIIENQQSNSSIGIARNLLIKNSNAQYLYFLDSDDYIESHTIKLLVNEAIMSNADIVKSSYQCVDESGKVLKKCQYKYDAILDSITLKRNVYVFGEYHPVYSWNKLYRMSFLKSNNLSYLHNFHEDLLFYFLELEKANKIALLKSITYNYVIRNNSLTRSAMTAEKAEVFINVRNFVYDYLRKDNSIIALSAKIDYFIICYIMIARDVYQSAHISASKKCKLYQSSFEAPAVPLGCLLKLLFFKKKKLLISVVVRTMPLRLNVLILITYNCIKKIISQLSPKHSL
jgi:glycosyltransferase involved in cell wall biosynthesis